LTAEERNKVRNETIDELTNWLQSCIEQVDHSSEVYKACSAMIKAMQAKKQPDTASLGTVVKQSGEVVTHYPLSKGQK